MSDGRERRSLVKWLIGGGFVASLTSFLYPAIRYLSPPKTSQSDVNQIVAGKTNSLPPNSGKIVRFGDQPVILIHVRGDDWRAFSAICTHLSCIVQYDPDRRQIWCPCHDGRYDLRGNVVGGPPPKPLEEYQVRLSQDEVVVTRKS